MILNNEIVIEKAKDVGFDLIGFAKADRLHTETEKLSGWLKSGYQATMDYMERNFEKRLDVKNILPDAKSVISLAVNYNTNHSHEKKDGFGKISRYAWGKDYHLVLWEKTELLEEELKKIEPAFECKSYVDTGPVMDKAWAVRAGIGWLGKHSNVINKEIGSWFFIATMITNWEFRYNEVVSDHCGTCRACIDACPTEAIVANYVVDANKCISFLTIENKGDIPLHFEGKFDNWLFGCDICQDVCPWNKKFDVPASHHQFEPVNKEIQLSEVEKMDQVEFKRRFETSPIKRAKLAGLKRNALFLKRNTQV